MMRKTQNPGPVRVQGLGEVCFEANLSTKDTLHTSPKQDPIAWLARRARLNLPTAAAIAAANGWGVR